MWPGSVVRPVTAVLFAVVACLTAGAADPPPAGPGAASAPGAGGGHAADGQSGGEPAHTALRAFPVFDFHYDSALGAEGDLGVIAGVARVSDQFGMHQAVIVGPVATVDVTSHGAAYGLGIGVHGHSLCDGGAGIGSARLEWLRFVDRREEGVRLTASLMYSLSLTVLRDADHPGHPRIGFGLGVGF